MKTFLSILICVAPVAFAIWFEFHDIARSLKVIVDSVRDK